MLRCVFRCPHFLASSTCSGGCGALGYLWVLHLAILLPNKSTRLELCRGYLALLFLRSKAAGSGYSLWKKLLQLFYKQSTPTRRWAMVLEDAPQGVIASVISVADGLKPFTLAVNLLIPFARLLLAWMYHDHIAWEVQDWLKNEALDAHSAGRLALRDEYLAALRRLEGVAQKRGWGSVLAVRELLQTLIPTRSADRERVRAGDGGCMSMRVELGENEGVVEKPFCFSVHCTRIVDDERNSWLQHGPPGPCEELRLSLGPGSELLELTKELPEAQLLALTVPPGRLPCRVDLRLWYCALGDECCRVLCESLRQIGPGCEELLLWLTKNAITSEGAELLAEGLEKMTALTKLELKLNSNPELGDAGCRALCRGLRGMPELRSLDLRLYGTGLGAEGCAALAAALRELQLQELRRL